MLHEKFDHFQIWANNTQHVATCHNRVAKRTQHPAPNKVVICYIEILLSFGRGFRSFKQLSFKENCNNCLSWLPVRSFIKLLVLIVEQKPLRSLPQIYPDQEKQACYNTALPCDYLFPIYMDMYAYLPMAGDMMSQYYILLYSKQFFLFCLVLPFNRKGDTCFSVQQYHNRYYGSMFWKGKLTDSSLVWSPM